ncbi:MAG: sensor domain-containing diguanylate cyclase [Ardenticatenaceae bacterium]|nr:sensor domain-containing diguanylate cyclase [Ardenticatenaceae bacterium]HBY98339.1 hypothetical protein [Chloroflexota bacterium]
MARTLRGQLLTYGVLAVLLAMVLSGAVGLIVVQARTRALLRTQMLSTAVALASGLEQGGPAQGQALLDTFRRGGGADAGYDAVVVDLAGRVVAATDLGDVGKPVDEAIGHAEPGLQRVLAGELPVAFEEMTHRGLPVLDLSLPLHADPVEAARITGGLHLSMPYRPFAPLVWRQVAALGLFALLLAALLVVPLWFYLERSLVRPLRLVVAANRDVGEGRPAPRRIPDRAMPHHELGELMRSLNEMLARLEAADGELRRRLRELSALSSTAVLLSQSAPLEEWLRQTLEKVLEITGADAGEVSLFEPGLQRLVVRAHQGFWPDWLTAEADRPTPTLCSAMAERRKFLSLEDVSQDEHRSRLAYVRKGLHGYCDLPLEAEGQVLGGLRLHSRQEHKPSPLEQDLLAAIASQIAVALMNVRLYQETRRLATTDPLTGLANRRVLEERLADEFRRARRYEHALTLIMTDLDHFKVYNDTHGHPAGDVVLRELAILLQGSVRETDLVARYGGEEFVILLPETARAAALVVGEKIRAAVEQHPFAHRETQPSGRLTISVGVATFPEGLEQPETLLHSADRALYQAKAMGRNRVYSSAL